MAIRLVNRADDIGSSLIANEAIIDAHTDGTVTNTSLMVPAPHFKDAAERLKACPSLEVGIHATITDEWDTPRWGPVLPVAEVPSIVYDDGTFYKNCVELWGRYGDETTRPSNDEIIKEITEQIRLARAAGLDPKYMDTHMGFDWFHGLADRLAELCDSEGMIYANNLKINRLPQVEGAFEDPIDGLVASLLACEDNTDYLLVAHPAYARGDMVDMSIRGSAPGFMAESRDGERRRFMDQRVKDAIAEKGIECVPYSVVAQ